MEYRREDRKGPVSFLASLHCLGYHVLEPHEEVIVEMPGGGGSPVMETIAIMSQYDVETRKRLVRRLAGIPEA